MRTPDVTIKGNEVVGQPSNEGDAVQSASSLTPVATKPFKVKVQFKP